MKKFSILLMATLIAVCAVGCTKDVPETAEPASTPTQMSQTDELALEKLNCFYVNTDYFKELSISKSTADSQSFGSLARTDYDETSGDYTLTLGDFHQGGTTHSYCETVYDEAEKQYIVKYEQEGKEVILTYSEEDDTYHILGNLPSGMALDNDMIKFDSLIAFYESVTNTVLKDSADVTVKDENKLYITLEDKEYQLLITPDATIDSEESYKMRQEGALGYIYLVDETDEDDELFLIDGTLYYYFIDNENFIIKNANGDVITTFSLK